MTPAIRPPMPANAKFASGSEIQPVRLKKRDNTKPQIPPMTKVGPKVPPTPPPALVSDIEKTLANITNTQKTSTNHPELLAKEL